MKAIQLSHDHPKLKTLSRELFLEHGWTMPRGLVESKERNPRNFSLAEWQQAKRIGKDPRQIKTAIQDAWAVSDSKASFAHALQECGYVLARGDKGRFVAVDTNGEAYAIARQLDVKTKALRQRLGDGDDLPTVDNARQQVTTTMLPVMQQFQAELQTAEAQQKQATLQKLRELVETQRAERQAFLQKQAQQQQREALARQARFRSGLWGFWDKLRGTNKRIQAENERDATLAKQRDRDEKDRLIAEQLSQRLAVREQTKAIRGQFQERNQELAEDIQHFETLQKPDLRALRDSFMQTSKASGKHGAKPDRETPARDRQQSR
jgi:hypothetical protein